MQLDVQVRAVQPAHVLLRCEQAFAVSLPETALTAETPRDLLRWLLEAHGSPEPAAAIESITLPVGSTVDQAERALIEHVLAGIDGLFAEVLVSVAPGRPYDFLSHPQIPDPAEGLGPLAGILAGLKAARFDPAFCPRLRYPGRRPRAHCGPDCPGRGIRYCRSQDVQGAGAAPRRLQEDGSPAHRTPAR